MTADPPAAGSRTKPIKKIALEEHFMAPDFVQYFAAAFQNLSPDLAKRVLAALSDFGDQRLETMDQNHLDFVVLSLSGPGLQAEKDAAVAHKKARSVNDLLANEIRKRPGRYGGFAHLAMHDPRMRQTNWSAVCAT
jgi:2,3-dihydroxybenzoate decarboxylase